MQTYVALLQSAEDKACQVEAASEQHAEDLEISAGALIAQHERLEAGFRARDASTAQKVCLLHMRSLIPCFIQACQVQEPHHFLCHLF